MRDKGARYCHVSMSFSILGGVCWEWCGRGPNRTVAIYCKVSGAQRGKQSTCKFLQFYLLACWRDSMSCIAWQALSQGKRLLPMTSQSM